jgi:hypothetical protein
VKYFRQIVWHIFPMLVVFLITMGVQLFVVTFIATVLILISGGDNVGEFNSTWEPIIIIMIVLFNALVPCVVLFPTVWALDRLTSNRPVWLKVMLPIPFMLASAFLAFLVYIYFHIQIPEVVHDFWLSLIDELVILMVALVAILALFAPYWYVLHIQRGLVEFVKKIRTGINGHDLSIWS